MILLKCLRSKCVNQLIRTDQLKNQSLSSCSENHSEIGSSENGSHEPKSV
jgi:hypothetical protein